jgi:hypothetical protein
MLKILLISVLLSISVPALAAYKCESGGKVTYSDTPCEGGKMVSAGDSPSSSETAKASRQAEQDKLKLKRIENGRHKQEVQEERERQQAARANAVKRSKCAALERRAKWSNEDAARATGKNANKAKLKARRTSEHYEAECSKSGQMMY